MDARTPGLLGALGIPRDPRGIILVCGYVVAAAFGLVALLTPPSDPIGWAYIALAVLGYLFLQARGLTAFLWLLVAIGGALIALGGAPTGWVQFGLGVALSVVGVAATPDMRGARAVTGSAISVPPPAVLGDSNGDSSSFLEDSGTQTSSLLEETRPPSQPSRSKRLVMIAIGRLRFVQGEPDTAFDIEDKPMLAFLFKYLLARAVIGDPNVARSGLAEELSPGVPDSSQRERLRKNLYDLQHLPAIGSLVHANRNSVWLDLEGADSDIGDLQKLVREIRERGFLLTSDLAARITEMLDRTTQDLLGGFEEQEHQVNQGRGTAMQVIGAARESIASDRVELILALAEYQDAIGHPEAAIAPLQTALSAMPDRQDLARLLVVAYLKTGQPARASDVRRQFALKQE